MEDLYDLGSQNYTTCLNRFTKLVTKTSQYHSLNYEKKMMYVCFQGTILNNIQGISFQLTLIQNGGTSVHFQVIPGISINGNFLTMFHLACVNTNSRSWKFMQSTPDNPTLHKRTFLIK